MNLGVEKATGRVPSATPVALRAGIHFKKMGAEIEEECESGRIGTIGNRVKGNLPWVQIPPPPPLLPDQDLGELGSILRRCADSVSAFTNASCLAETLSSIPDRMGCK